MAIDNKLTSSILDLSRNVDKLTSELKRNQSVKTSEAKSDETATAISEMTEALKDSGLKDLPKQFGEFSDRIEKLDFSELSKQFAKLDFKGLVEDLKGFKPNDIAQQSLKKIASETFKDLKTNILGGLEKGGDVSKTGNYIVGERGPEIVKLKTGDKVVPNSDLMNQEIIKMLAESKKETATFEKKRPSGEEIGRKRMQLLIENPEYAENPEELEDEIKDYIERYGRETFTREDVAKLTKPVKPAELPKTENTAVTGGEISSKKSESPDSKKRTAEPILAGTLKSKIEAPKNIEPALKQTGETILKPESEKSGVKKESGFSKITSKLGKIIGDVFSTPEKGRAGTFSETGGINLESSLSPATKKSTPANMVDFIKPTLQKTTTKISSPPKISKELGSLSKAPELNKPAEDSKLMFGGLIQKMEDVFSKKSSSRSETSSTENSSSAGIEPPTESGQTLPGQEKNSGLSKDDVNEMKSVLLRIASLLEGPISVTPLDYPFRPDSRRV